MRPLRHGHSGTKHIFVTGGVRVLARQGADGVEPRSVAHRAWPPPSRCRSSTPTQRGSRDDEPVPARRGVRHRGRCRDRPRRRSLRALPRPRSVQDANVTTGQVYSTVIAKERRASTSRHRPGVSRTSPTRSRTACSPCAVPAPTATSPTSSSPRSAAPSATSSRSPHRGCPPDPPRRRPRQRAVPARVPGAYLAPSAS